MNALEKLEKFLDLSNYIGQDANLPNNEDYEEVLSFCVGEDLLNSKAFIKGTLYEGPKGNCNYDIYTYPWGGHYVVDSFPCMVLLDFLTNKKSLVRVWIYSGEGSRELNQHYLINSDLLIHSEVK